MGKGINSTEADLTEREHQSAPRQIFYNHTWKLNAGLEGGGGGGLLLGMEIALPHAISHAKVLLSTVT